MAEKSRLYSLNETKNAFGGSVLTSNLFRISVIKSPAGTKTVDSAIFLKVKSGDTPKSTTEILNLELQGHQFIGATKTSYRGSIALTSIDGVNADFFKMLTDMDETRNKRTQDDVTGLGSNIADQKADFKFVLLAQNGDVVRTYNLNGCIVHITGTSGITSDGLTPLEISFTIEYDSFQES